MSKLKIILTAFSFIGLLTYICFYKTVDNIKKDFLLEAYSLYAENNLSRVNIEVKGESIETKRVLVLTGGVMTKKLKERATSIAFLVNGIKGVENNLQVIETNEILKFKVKKRKIKSYYNIG